MYGVLPYILTMASPSGRRRAHEHKTERIELRVAPSVRRLIERATAISGLAVEDLAREGAQRVLADHARMVLRGEDRDAVLTAISHPPRPAPRLIASLRQHRAHVRQH